jgi:hypothetical protein
MNVMTNEDMRTVLLGQERERGKYMTSDDEIRISIMGEITYYYREYKKMRILTRRVKESSQRDRSR